MKEKSARVSKGRSLVMRTADRLEMPADILAGLPKMEIVAGLSVYLRNHNGILSYSEEEILISGGAVIIRVCGSGLTLKAMNRRELSISGKLDSVSFSN